MGWLDDVVNSARDTISNPTTYLNPAILGQANFVSGAIGGGKSAPFAIDPNVSAAYRNSDINYGRGIGKEIFNSEEMTNAQKKYDDLAKGYSGEELGALKESANREIEGQRGGYLRSLSGQAARGGIGGARRAAMQGSADRGFLSTKADANRKLVADNANLVRQGTNDATNFLLQRRFGELGTGLGYAQLGSADRNASTQTQIAQQEPKKGILGQVFGGLF